MKTQKEARIKMVYTTATSKRAKRALKSVSVDLDCPVKEVLELIISGDKQAIEFSRKAYAKYAT